MIFFKIKDLASDKAYTISYQDKNWWLFDPNGEGIELFPEGMFLMVDQYFKNNKPC